jgi:general secretion pathway protein B
VSFILDALRKSEHERQRSALPGLAHVPLAAPTAQLPRWALVVIGMLGVAVLVLGGAWWQSLRAPARVATSAPLVERPVELPPPISADARRPSVALGPSAMPRTEVRTARDTPLAEATPSTTVESSPAPVFAEQPTARPPITNEPTLPSAAALLAQGVALPPLRLELHAFSERPSDRFVFINGRKYVEGERLPEGPQVVAIEPAGAVLVHNGQRFLLVGE